MATHSDLLDALKLALRSAKLTYADVADHLDISEASVKRLFSTGQTSLDRVSKICDLAGLSFEELARLAAQHSSYLTELTAAQERRLVEDPQLLLVTYLALNRWTFDEILMEYELKETELIHLLAELDKLKIIELLPLNRFKLLTARNFTWRKDGPVEKLVRSEVIPEYLSSSFDAEEQRFHFLNALLSESSLQRLGTLIDQLAREYDSLAKADEALPLSEKNSCSALLTLRPWEYSVFAKQRNL